MSTKRFGFKSLTTLVLLLIAVLGLVACGEKVDPNIAIVDGALSEIALTYGTGDSVNNVTKNITLPAKVGEVSVTWTSSNAAVVSVAGVVTRGTTDTVVSLTATLTLGKVSETKVFTVTVKAAEPVTTPEEALAAITISGSTLVLDEGTGRYTTSTDITLPATALGLAVTWTSPNPTVLSATGVVVRPAWGQNDSTVILVATVGDEVREFIVKVLAINVKPDEVSVAEAKEILLLNGISDGVATDLVLPTSAGTEGVVVTWTSNNPEVISNTGVVSRQPDSVTVTLTATLTKGTASETKTFDVVVLPFAPYVEVASIDAAKALYIANQALEDKPITYARIEDVTIVGVSGDGFMIYDGATLMFVFTKSTPAATIVAGSVVHITGYIDNFFGSWQINGTKDAERPVVLRPSTAAASVLEPTEITTSIADYIATLPKTYSMENGFPTTYITLTAKVRVQGLGNYEALLVDVNYAGGNIDTTESNSTIPNAFVVYYKSNQVAIRELAEQKIKINVFLYSLRDDRNVFTVIFTGVKADIEILPLTDLESVNAAKVQSVSGLPEYQETTTTLALPTDILGTTIVWSSSHPTLIDATTGIVTPVDGEQTAVTLTATITKGTETATATKVVKVGQLPLSTMEQVVAAEANSSLYRVQGVVTSGDANGTFFIQSGEAGIAVYTTNSTLKATLTANVGKMVEVVAAREKYNGLNQLVPTQVKAVSGTVEIVAVNIDAVEFTNEALLPYQGRVITLTDLRVKKIIDANKTGNVELERVVDGKVIVLRLGNAGNISGTVKTAFEALKVGDIVSITTPLSWYQSQPQYFGPQLLMNNQTVIVADTVTDAVKLSGDKARLNLPTEVKTNSTLTLPSTGLFGSTITWATSDAAVITAAGVVTIPTSGQIDVTLTATLTLGSLTETKSLVIKVGLSDQDKVDSDAAALVVVAAQTAATTITLPVTGANGSAIVWTSSNNALIDPATGAVVMPASGQVVVTLTATLSLNAATKVMTYEVTLGTPTSTPTGTIVTATSANTAGNMIAGENPTSNINLSSDIFTLTVVKGTTSSIVGMYAELRLYGDKATGDGNEIIIGVKEGYQIIGVKIVFGASTNSATTRVTLGTAVTNLTIAESLNSTSTFADLAISSFGIKNTGMSTGSSNPQVRILSIEITYIVIPA